jgi:peptidoglycan hydrolase-like protein with peptidoglycan-binding domain
MKQKSTTANPSFMTKNKDLIVVGGVIVVLAGAATAYYFITKKKEKKEAELTSASSGVTTVASGSSSYQTPPFIPSSSTSSSSSTKPVITKTGYPIKYGSRNPDVKILQRYLKIYKEDLGKTGPKRDGVDGQFGPKTSRAAQKRLKKTVFTQADIAGMRKALSSLGK